MAGDTAVEAQVPPALDALEEAADMVALEGPENLAEIADRMYHNACRLGGQRLPNGGRIVVIDRDSPGGARMWNEARASLGQDLPELLKQARQYLNEGRA